MSRFDDRLSLLTSQVAATPGKRVLVVEGTTDIDFLTWMFDKPPLKAENLHTRWVIGDAGGKSAVLRMLSKKPKWVGLVDRDAWGEGEFEAARKRYPNLFFLPRYCIENYLVDPRLIGQLLGDPRNAGRREALRAAQRHIQGQEQHAVRHGSLWRAVQPLQEALQELGFSSTLLRYRLPDDEQVRQILISWSELMDWRRVYAQYEAFGETAAAMTRGKALAVWVHGKMFWQNVVGPALCEAMGEDSTDRLARRLFRSMELPGDVLALVRRMIRYQADVREQRKGKGKA